MNNTPITLEDILETLAEMEYVSDESLKRFQKQVEQHGINDETLELFSELINEELQERETEISAGEIMIGDHEEELQKQEPRITHDLQRMQTLIQHTFQDIGNRAEQAYNQIASDTFTAIQEDQKAQDDRKADEVKKSIGL